MGRFNIKSTCNAPIVVALILALSVKVPFADGLLLHDHSDHGVHSHAVTFDDMREGYLCASWHRDHDDFHDDDRNNDSEDDKYAESLLIFVGFPTTAIGIHGTPGAVMASIQYPSSSAMPRAIVPSDLTATARFSCAPWPSAHPLRPAFALDALLQSSCALLL